LPDDPLTKGEDQFAGLEHPIERLQKGEANQVVGDLVKLEGESIKAQRAPSSHLLNGGGELTVSKGSLKAVLLCMGQAS
jgi:hypothetical protein